MRGLQDAFIRWVIGLLLSFVCFIFGVFVYTAISTIHAAFGAADRGLAEIFIAPPTFAFAACAVLGFHVAVCVFPTALLPTVSLALLARRHWPSAMLALGPLGLAALATTLLYDYGVPNYRFYTDQSPDWVHGLTSRRYGVALTVHCAIVAAALVPRGWEGLRRLIAKQGIVR